MSLLKSRVELYWLLLTLAGCGLVVAGTLWQRHPPGPTRDDFRWSEQVDERGILAGRIYECTDRGEDSDLKRAAGLSAEHAALTGEMEDFTEKHLDERGRHPSYLLPRERERLRPVD